MSTVAILGVAIVLLVVFVWLESRVAHPLLPLHVVAHRARGGAFLAVFIAGSAIFAVFLFLTYYMQQNKGYSPLQTGLGFLPLAATIMLTAPRINSVWLGRLGARTLITSGMVLGVGAMVWLTRLETHTGYVLGILPGLILLGLAMAATMAPSFAAATLGVDPEHVGAASGTVNTAQQIGGAVGTALLSSIFAGAIDHPGGLITRTEAIRGYHAAFWAAAGLFALGALVVPTALSTERVRSAGGRAAASSSGADAEAEESDRLVA